MSPVRHYRWVFALNQSGFLALRVLQSNMWHEINTSGDVPKDRDLRLAVIDGKGTVHALVFPCRRVGNSWVDAKLKRQVEVYPTHWQEWLEDNSPRR